MTKTSKSNVDNIDASSNMQALIDVNIRKCTHTDMITKIRIWIDLTNDRIPLTTVEVIMALVIIIIIVVIVITITER